MQPCVLNPQSFVCRSSVHDSHTLKNKIEAVFIDEVHCVAKKCSILFIFTLLESNELYTTFRSASFLLSSCLKFAFFVFRGFLADISHPYTWKDWSSAVLSKSEVIRVKFVEIRPFANKAVISIGSKNSGFENSFKNCSFYDVIAVISRQQYAN